MGRQVRGSRSLRLALDVAAVAVMALTFAGTGDPDILFHVVWVILTISTFLYGLRGSLPRIGVVAAAVVVYSVLGGPGANLPPELAENLLISEWPLMLAIIVMVAVMADREITASHRYAGLYRRAADKLISAQEDERGRLARDLHDGVGQTLTAIGLTLDAAATSLDGATASPAGTVALDLPAASQRVDTARLLTARAIDDAREVAARLLPIRLTERGLAAAIEELASTAATPVEMRIAEDASRPGLLDPTTELEAFRIVQEAIANAARHAHASLIVVGLRLEPESLDIEIADDGTGFAVPDRDARTLGIAGMRERAAMIGARLLIHSRPGRGTTVGLTVPLGPAMRRVLAQRVQRVGPPPKAAT